MSVQEDLQLSFDESNVRVEGLVDMGGVCDDLHKLNSHKDEVRMAKYVLQFVYLGFDGFRFPIAYFPSDGANAPELYLNIWNMISALGQYGFSIKYACFDGGSSKRAFQLMHFANKEDAMEKNFTTLNPFSQNENITLIMDYSHNIKKIRNNIYASGEHEMCTRKLKRNDNYIVWTHWINAYNWDRSV